jgi:hypothetical protein
MTADATITILNRVFMGSSPLLTRGEALSVSRERAQPIADLGFDVTDAALLGNAGC